LSSKLLFREFCSPRTYSCSFSSSETSIASSTLRRLPPDRVSDSWP
jgi:hypothetical protein